MFAERPIRDSRGRHELKHIWELLERKYPCHVVAYHPGLPGYDNAYQLAWTDAAGRSWSEWVTEASIDRVASHLVLPAARVS